MRVRGGSESETVWREKRRIKGAIPSASIYLQIQTDFRETPAGRGQDLQASHHAVDTLTWRHQFMEDPRCDVETARQSTSNKAGPFSAPCVRLLTRVSKPKKMRNLFFYVFSVLLWSANREIIRGCNCKYLAVFSPLIVNKILGFLTDLKRKQNNENI